MAGPDSAWTLDAQLLAGIHDRLAEANWQRGNAGSKSPRARPKPIPRPGVRGGRVGGTRRAPAEVARYLVQFAPTGGGD
ncbi:DUF5361 domain-containing protein [Streptomyces sp. NPDC017056]|uniref:DUF5361 domain-containing protein n=1 Tax=Streptomyces sp. NPDC017056 TaxID=3364973 RepID=UPI003793E17F